MGLVVSKETTNPIISFINKYLLIIPFLLFTSFFLLWPVLKVAIKSLQTGKGDWSFVNFKPILHGTYFHAFVVSIKLSLITAIISALIGALFTFTIVKYASAKFINLVDSACAVFANSGGVPLAFMFISAFGIEGIITKFLKFIGWDIYSGKFTLFSFTGVCLVYLFFLIPLMVIVFKPAVSNIRNEWAEASTSLGANDFTYYRRVIFPILMPSFLGGFFLLFAAAFSAYATARAMTTGTVPLVPIIIGNLVDGNVISNEANLGDALALGMIIVSIFSMTGYWLTIKWSSKWKSR
jgi:putative spermidine/putrescine transport system permease protein